MSLLVEIEKQLGNFHLDVRFQAETETLALLGASGCGKSMTLKCIAGIMTPDRGRIVLNGRVLFDSEARIDLPPQQRRVGYLFQNYALFPTMTVEKNILCGIRSGSKAEKAAALSATLPRFRLEVMETVSFPNLTLTTSGPVPIPLVLRLLIQQQIELTH